MNCPLCGSGQLVPHEQLEKLAVPYGPPCSFLRSEETCLVCKESGDFSGLNDARIEAALAKANQQSVAGMIDYLADMGISMAYVERALSLPPRTLSGWRDGECPPAGLALLRMVRSYPWLVKAAEAGFPRP